MNELEEIRRRREQELQMQMSEQMNQQLSEEMQMQKQVQALEMHIKQFLTKEALGRYSNVKVAHPEKAIQLLVVLGQAIQSGQLKQVDDAKLKEILAKLTPEKKEFKIKRK